MSVSRPAVIHLTVLIAVLAGATVLRVLDFPARYTVLDMDETGYCLGSVQLLEGITPGNKAAPAGPLYWAGWIYLAGETAWDLAHPSAVERHESMAVRPFTALDQVLFDNSRDVSSLRRAMVGLNVFLSLMGTAAAVGLGIRFSGAAGGLLLGGLFALTPVFLNLSEMARPYSMAWSFGAIALYFASSVNRRWILSAIFLGLSIGSRIEMLCLIPLVWWVFYSWREEGRWKITIAKLTSLSLCVASWVAPWLVTHLVGNLRTIATVRFAGTASASWSGALLDLFYTQGIGLVIMFVLVGFWFQPAGSRIRLGLLIVYTLCLTISMVMGYADGIHQHGAVLIGWFVLVAAMIGPMFSRWPLKMGVVLFLVLAFPLLQAVRQMSFNRSLEDHEDSVAWVEQHVPAETTLYLVEGGERTLLPTPAASAALWSEVTDDQAWRKKMQSGLSRFSLTADELPRALSEENLIQERSNRRKWFILGGHTDLLTPRFNIRIVASSPVFGVLKDDLEAAMKSQGGVLIVRDGFHINPPVFLGSPLKQWISPQGTGVRIYCSPDVRAMVH